MVRISLSVIGTVIVLCLVLLWLTSTGGASEQAAQPADPWLGQAARVSGDAAPQVLSPSRTSRRGDPALGYGGDEAPPADYREMELPDGIDQRPPDRKHADSLFALRWAAAKGLPPEAVDRILEGIHPSALATFFEERTHMDRAWLQRNGLDEGVLPELFRMYVGSGMTPGTEQAPEPVGLSTYALSHGNVGVYSDVFADKNSTVFLHYTVPPDYQADAVIIRWVETDNRSLVHVDRHYTNATPHERQEAWIRQPEGWAPGQYRVEIFAADAELTPLAATDYRVFRYGVD